MRFVKSLPPKVKRAAPATYNGGGGAMKYQDIADKLRKRPHTWAVWRSSDLGDRKLNVAASQVKSGKYAAFRPAGHFEAAVRHRGDQAHLYVRYVGEEGRPCA